MDYGGRPDISTILKRWGTEHEWGGGGESQWFHTIAAAKFILTVKTLVGSLWGKTMNSWLFYHDVMNTLPALPEADKRSLAPPDLFPHK